MVALSQNYMLQDHLKMSSRYHKLAYTSYNSKQPTIGE